MSGKYRIRTWLRGVLPYVLAVGALRRGWVKNVRRTWRMIRAS